MRRVLAGFLRMGAAEDGRAPTEERSSGEVRSWCGKGAAEDGRAPTEEPSSGDKLGRCGWLRESLQKLMPI